MLLNKEVSNYTKGKIIGNSYSDKKTVQYILELCKLEDYIKNGFKGPYYVGFGLDYLIDRHFDDYIELIKEIKGKEESISFKSHYIYADSLIGFKEQLICKGVDFSHSGEMKNLENVWVELGGVK